MIILNIDPFLIKLLPFKSSQSQLSNGANIIKNESILRKIWINRVEGFQNQAKRTGFFSTLCVPKTGLGDFSNLCVPKTAVRAVRILFLFLHKIRPEAENSHTYDVIYTYRWTAIIILSLTYSISDPRIIIFIMLFRFSHNLLNTDPF